MNRKVLLQRDHNTERVFRQYFPTTWYGIRNNPEKIQDRILGKILNWLYKSKFFNFVNCVESVNGRYLLFKIKDISYTEVLNLRKEMALTPEEFYFANDLYFYNLDDIQKMIDV